MKARAATTILYITLLVVSIACLIPAVGQPTATASLPASLPAATLTEPTLPPTPAPTATHTATPTASPTPEPSPTAPDPHGPQGWVWVASEFVETGVYKILIANQEGVTSQIGRFPINEVYDFNRAAGKLAYAGTWSHAAEGGHTAVTDLWVYDFQSGKNERWLADNVTWASWAPGQPERLAVSIYNPEEQHQELLLVQGPGLIEVLAGCVSPFFAWAPDGASIAFVAHDVTSGVPERCYGTYQVSPPSPGAQRVSEFGRQALQYASVGEKPVWMPEHQALLYASGPLWVIPLDGSPYFRPRLPDQTGIDADVALWSSPLQLLVTQISGMTISPSIQVFALSDDLHTLAPQYNLEDPQQRIDYWLVDWWEPGYSLLVHQIDYSGSETISTYRVWELDTQTWREIQQPPPIFPHG